MSEIVDQLIDKSKRLRGDLDAAIHRANEVKASIEQQTCDHVVGQFLDCTGAWQTFRNSNEQVKQHGKIDLFNYCPTCGARLETV